MDVIVIGGGPAGMIAAIQSARCGCRVTLLEQNEKLGKKLYITGKGRCNVTNGCETEELFDHMVTNKEFMYSGFYMWTNHQVMDFFEELGCPLKVERGNRVFPISNHSSDVIRALTQELKKQKVKVSLHTKVNRLLTKEGRISGVRLESGEEMVADKVIVATGGKSYALTGSTGDGYRFAKAAGHHVTSLVPALAPLEIKGDDCKRLQGLSLRNVQVWITTGKGKKPLYQDFGEMLFTHFGVSGPVILSLSSYIHKYIKDQVELHLDLKPALSQEQLDHRILRDFEEVMNKEFKNSLDQLLPKKLIPIMIEKSGIPEHKKVHEITKQERQHLGQVLKDYTMEVKGVRGFNEAIITQGGVDVKEISPSTMESKLMPGLYFAGEVLDLDAVTGGYNLQIAWSTGFLAGTV